MLQRYDVLQSNRGVGWEDFSTLRTEEEFTIARRNVRHGRSDVPGAQFRVVRGCDQVVLSRCPHCDGAEGDCARCHGSGLVGDVGEMLAPRLDGLIVLARGVQRAVGACDAAINSRDYDAAVQELDEAEARLGRARDEFLAEVERGRAP